MSQYEYGGDRSGGTHQVLVSLVPPTARRVLDVGCASGYLGRELMRRPDCAVWGIEVDEQSAAAARQEGYADVLCADLNDLPRLSWSAPFDAVLAGDVLEHLIRPDTVLSRVRDLLRPGAPLIVSLPNVANATVRLNLLRGRFDYRDTGILDRTHVHLYTYKTARELLTSNGFAIDAEYGGSGLFGSFLNGRLPGARRLRPLLAHTIVMVAT